MKAQNSKNVFFFFFRVNRDCIPIPILKSDFKSEVVFWSYSYRLPPRDEKLAKKAKAKSQKLFFKNSAPNAKSQKMVLAFGFFFRGISRSIA